MHLLCMCVCLVSVVCQDECVGWMHGCCLYKRMNIGEYMLNKLTFLYGSMLDAWMDVDCMDELRWLNIRVAECMLNVCLLLCQLF